MVDSLGIITRVIPITERTRASATIYDNLTGQEYRVTPPGPSLNEKEWRTCFDAVFDIETDYIVATGSLPSGVPDDFYASLASTAKDRGARLVLDTSGPALELALDEGVFLAKPNLRELERLTGEEAKTEEEQELLVKRLIDEGKAEIVALTLGPDGALLGRKEGVFRLPSPDVEVKSAVGAGDSFLAGMTFGLASGMSVEDSFALGVATGTATVLTAGSELCRRSDIARLFSEISNRPLPPQGNRIQCSEVH